MTDPVEPNRWRELWWLAPAIVAGVLLYLLSPILAPFLFGAILAYIFDPLVERLARLRIPRAVAAAAALAGLFALLALMVLVLLPLFVDQARTIAAQAPFVLDRLRLFVAPWVEAHFGIELETSLVRDWLLERLPQLQSLAASLLPTVRSGGLVLLGVLLNLVLVPVVTFYLLRDWDKVVARTAEMIPNRWRGQVAALAGEIDMVLGQFLRGQLLVMAAMAAIYSAGLWLVGLDSAVAVGVVAGLVTFVPYLGLIIGVALATVSGVMQFGALGPLLWIWAVFAVGNVIENYALVPGLVGKRLGLHPVAVIFALLAFGQLFGFFGLLLALPASAALMVWLRHLRRGYLASDAYNA
jgi:predicted PurR-regulated permease PerM